MSPEQTIEPAVVLRTTAGHAVAMHLSRWTDEATAAELLLLDRAVGSVIDLGCGPGRHVVALAERGVAALGVDCSPAALDLARQRGASVLERSIFDELPGSGRWGTALLLDGNIGIGGNPLGLLERVATLVRTGGRLLLEVGPPADPSERLTVRVESNGRHSEWFPWSTLAADDLVEVATGAGWLVNDLWTDEDRWFAQLDRP